MDIATPSEASSALSVGHADAVLSWLAQGPERASQMTQLLLDRAASSGAMNIYIHVAKVQALEQAQQRDASWQHPSQGALHGLPLVVKDNIDVLGMPTTSGSPALNQHAAQQSASALSKLTRAGAVILGKVNLHELCFGITSNNATHGAVRNPYAPTHISGGSSGGTAAAIAAGLAPAGIGSDTGGSLRIPAALCGVVGFRPTTGRWPSDGVVKISHTRDTLGPMGRTVADCALLDAVVCDESLALDKVQLRGLRIGIPLGVFWRDLDSEVEKFALNVREKLRAAGVELVDCDPGFDAPACDHAGMVIAMYEALPCLEDYMRGHALPFDTAQITSRIASPDVRAIFEFLRSPQSPTAADYAQALDIQRPALQQAYADCFNQHRLDALLFPTTPLPATPIGQDDMVTLAGQSVPTFPTYTRNVAPGSVAGLPGISIPMGCNSAGLPMGIALDGPAGSDRRLLAIAQALQHLIGTIPPAPMRA